jgi:ubiquitin-protein ligase
MATPDEIRENRLRKDWEEMKKIISPVIDWIGYGNPPTMYDVTYNIRSIIGLKNSAEPIYRDVHKVAIEIPSGYPFSGESIVAKMYDGYSPAFHPNFWPGGIICIWGNGNTAWDPNETIAMVCTRIARLLQFDQYLTQESHRANPHAADWYAQQKNSGLFPTDKQPVPLPASLDDDDDFSFAM